ncbi:MAG: sulfurtransferase-like selenium metabolism protein YedF [Peptostreptococcaceae bacterium]|nr:sulfurtransferase-like selenium metabolism protein YedF [Peptostreptococcaceae bacterium]
MKKVDARGLECPAPVIETKKIMEEGIEEILVVVDNDTASRNIRRLADKKGYELTEEIRDDGIYLKLKGKDSEAEGEVSLSENETGDWALLILSDRMGSGSDELGEILMKGYFYALTETKPFPKAVLFLNGGIKLALKGSSVLKDLKVLQEQGVEMLVCGTCLDYFEEKENLGIGVVSNMYDIVEKMNEAPKVVRA